MRFLFLSFLTVVQKSFFFLGSLPQPPTSPVELVSFLRLSLSEWVCDVSLLERVESVRVSFWVCVSFTCLSLSNWVEYVRVSYDCQSDFIRVGWVCESVRVSWMCESEFIMWICLWVCQCELVMSVCPSELSLSEWVCHVSLSLSLSKWVFFYM